MTDGDQVPVIPLGEVVARVGTVSPEQNVYAVGKSGDVEFVWVTFSVTVAGH